MSSFSSAVAVLPRPYVYLLRLSTSIAAVAIAVLSAAILNYKLHLRAVSPLIFFPSIDQNKVNRLDSLVHTYIHTYIY